MKAHRHLDIRAPFWPDNGIARRQFHGKFKPVPKFEEENDKTTKLRPIHSSLHAPA